MNKFKPGDRVRKVSGLSFSNGENVVTVDKCDIARGLVWLKETKSSLMPGEIDLVESYYYDIPDKVVSDVAKLIAKFNELGIEETSYDIMLAGGAMRDQIIGSYHGQAEASDVKDWDIFISAHKRTWFVGQPLDHFLQINMDYVRATEEQYETDSFRVYNSVAKAGEPAVQLIFKVGETYEETLKAFDFDICKVAHVFWTGGLPADNPLVMVDKFEDNLINKRHNCLVKSVENKHQEKLQMDRHNRILEKYYWTVEYEYKSKFIKLTSLGGSYAR